MLGASLVLFLWVWFCRSLLGMGLQAGLEGTVSTDSRKSRAETTPKIMGNSIPASPAIVNRLTQRLLCHIYSTEGFFHDQFLQPFQFNPSLPLL